MKHEIATEHLARELARARKAIGKERLVPALAAPILFIGGWAAFGLTDLQSKLPPLLGSLAALAALALIVLLLARAVRAWRAPTLQDARERLARDAGLEPAALDALDDQPSRLNRDALVLWEREQARARDAAARAIAAPAQVRLDKIDRFRLRYVVIAALTIGVIFARWDAPDRLARAFVPDPGPFLGDGPMEIEAWATPAEYTGAGPIALTEKIGARVVTPPSVEVTVRVTGPVGAPYLHFDGSGAHRRIAFKKAADGAYEGKLLLPGAGALRVVRFHTKARWIMAPARDKPPTASFAGKPEIVSDHLVFKYKVSDDYGVRALKLKATPAEPAPPGLVGAKPVYTDLESPDSDPKAAEGDIDVDLTAHPYAGLNVNLSLVAVDARGQEGAGERVKLKLPEKIFLQPIARAAIEIRKAVLWERRPYTSVRKLRADQKPTTLGGFDVMYGSHRDIIRTDEFDPTIERAPKGLRRAGKMIDALTTSPQDGYFQDLTVFAGLRAARTALNMAREIDETNAAAGLLWEVALGAEYGSSANAKRALEEAQRQLSEAIARGDQGEVDRLADAVRQAMKNYLQALANEARRNGMKNPEQQLGDAQEREQKTLSRGDLEDIMREIQRLSAQGKTEEAQRLLQQLQQMMQNLEVQMAQPGKSQQGDGEQGGDQQLDKSVQGLSDAIGQQRGLRDETQRQEQGGDQSGEKNGAQSKQQSGQDKGESGEQLAQRQEAIKRALDEASKDAQAGGSKSNGDLDRAGEAMARAEQALRRGDFAGARGAQDEALRQMRAGAQRLSQQAEKGQKGAEGKDENQPGAAQKDPLGRPIGGMDLRGDETNVPEAIQRERVRDILDELRRRIQDPSRTDSEREYLRRLLERFGGS